MNNQTQRGINAETQSLYQKAGRQEGRKAISLKSHSEGVINLMPVPSRVSCLVRLGTRLRCKKESVKYYIDGLKNCCPQNDAILPETNLFPHSPITLLPSRKNPSPKSKISTLPQGAGMHRCAFTLAEVLITLGIIGVVAAITLPGLIYNYQKKTWIEGLKVGVSTLEQGFKMALADDGVDDLRNTHLWINCDGTGISYNSPDWKNKCEPELSKYFKGVKFESVPDMQALGDTTNIMTDAAMCKKLAGKTNKWYYLNDKSKCRGWKNVAVTLANGMRADMIIGGTDHGYYVGSITALDVNGGKGPNTWGRDVFYLLILADGRVIGFYSRAHAEAYAKYNNVDFETKYNSFKTSRETNCSKTTTAAGNACSGRVIDEGWVMDY